MDLAQITAGSVGAVALLGSALALGLRHGLEWHHLIAITDITGTVVRPGPLGRPRPRLGVDPVAVGLASLYAAGHALVVIALGLAALRYQALLPDWIDQAMQRVIGATLLALGLWMLVAVTRQSRGAELRLPNRAALIMSGLRALRRTWAMAQQKLSGQACAPGYHVHDVRTYRRYGPRAAFAIGVVHGIGAETGTQVLLLASVGDAAHGAAGAGMLLAFVAGMLLSNTALAFVASMGFLSARHARAIFAALGVATAAASIYVGAGALLGIAVLPALGST